MLRWSDRVVEAVAMGMVFTCCLSLVAIGYGLGWKKAMEYQELPICEKHITVRDGSNVTHEFIVECGK